MTIRAWAWVNPHENRNGLVPKSHWWNDAKSLAELEIHAGRLSNWEGWKIALRLASGQLVYVTRITPPEPDPTA